MSGLVFCKDCKFIKPDWLLGIMTFGIGSAYMEYAKCMHPNSARVKSDLVRGEIKPKDYYYCSTQRAFENDCGSSGKWWEPKS